jgi:hypothetical protein
MIYFVYKFVDIRGGWYEIIIIRVILRGVMSLYSIGTFSLPVTYAPVWYQFSYVESGDSAFI